MSHLVKQIDLILFKSKFQNSKKNVSDKLGNCNNDTHLDIWLIPNSCCLMKQSKVLVVTLAYQFMNCFIAFKYSVFMYSS